jgi:hypothetical protein
MFEMSLLMKIGAFIGKIPLSLPLSIISLLACHDSLVELKLSSLLSNDSFVLNLSSLSELWD